MRSLFMLRLAARAPRRSGPVTSTLGVMNSVSASPSSASVVGCSAGTVGSLRHQEAAAGSSCISSATGCDVGSSRPRLACSFALRRQDRFFCAHVLRRSREPVEVTRSANSACPAQLHLQPHAGGNRSLSSTHPVRLARRSANATVLALAPHPRQHRCAFKASAHSTPGMPPNMSVNRTRYGMAPWPRGAVCTSSASRPGRHASARRLPLR